MMLNLHLAHFQTQPAISRHHRVALVLDGCSKLRCKNLWLAPQQATAASSFRGSASCLARLSSQTCAEVWQQNNPGRIKKHILWRNKITQYTMKIYEVYGLEYVTSAPLTGWSSWARVFPHTGSNSATEFCNDGNWTGVTVPSKADFRRGDNYCNRVVSFVFWVFTSFYYTAKIQWTPNDTAPLFVFLLFGGVALGCNSNN